MVESTCFQHTSSHPDKYNNSVNRIISKEEEREDPRRDSSIYLRVQCFHTQSIHSTRTTVFHTQSSNSKIFLHTELILPQEILQLQGSSRADHYKASPATVPVSPSILHGRIRLLAPLQVFQGHTTQAGSQQFYLAETAF